jgi:hypothetical protein
MYVKTRILESLPDLRPLPRAGGEAAGSDFRAAYGKAVGAGVAAEAPAKAGGAEKSVHVVSKGETLYGIARARLAATGATANAESSMRYALQLARANNIANPDRIRSGQTLELGAAITAPGRTGHPVAVVARTAGAAMALPIADAATAAGLTGRVAALERYTLHADDGDEPMSPAGLPTEPQDATVDAAMREPLMPFAPALPALAHNETIAEGENALRLAAAARQLALYDQGAGFAPEKTPAPARGLPEIFTKGVVGTVLDAVPIEAGTRTALQRANTIVSSAMTGRSLAAMTGIGGPILTIAGLLWGIFSSRQTEAAQSAQTKQPADTKQTAQTVPSATVN